MAAGNGKDSGKATGKPAETLVRSARTVLSAGSLAIVGASERGRWPTQIYQNLETHGYAGKIYLVNPRQKEVYGERAYPSLRDLPEAVQRQAGPPSVAKLPVQREGLSRQVGIGTEIVREVLLEVRELPVQAQEHVHQPR